ncbi:hypothetical protein QN239_15750 [Mycolicibacterium sp. Y3]
MNLNAIGSRGALAPMVQDELDRTTTMLAVRFPDCGRDEIASVVTRTYLRLAAGARITTHLIPLTLNISRRILALRTAVAGSTDVDGLSRRQALNTAPALKLDRGRAPVGSAVTSAVRPLMIARCSR